MHQATARPKVTIDQEEFLLIRDNPRDLGLDPDISPSARLQTLLHEAVLARKEQAARQKRLETYVEWAGDIGNRMAVAAVRDSMRELGGPLAAFGYRPIAEDDETSA